MCAIGYYLECAGIMTTGISLVRENTASMQPPRSLWVTFPLGRPLGKENDAAFQHRVIDAALALLARDCGPVLEDYLEEAPELPVESAPACPVSFARPADDDSWQGRLQAELATLKPWYELGRRRRQGRTLVGVSDFPIDENLQQLGELLDAETLQVPDLRWFKFAIEDVKAFYIEALTAQPGEHAHQQVQHTLWQETQFGAGLAQFYEWFRAHPKLSLFARLVASREAVEVKERKERNK